MIEFWQGYVYLSDICIVSAFLFHSWTQDMFNLFYMFKAMHRDTR